MIERSARAWMSIVIVQSMGSVWMSYFNQNAKNSPFKQHSYAISRAHALPIALLCVLRISLIIDFKSYSLHIVHIIFSILTAVSTLMEVFYFGTMTYGVITVTEVTLNGFSAVFMIFLLFMSSLENDAEESSKKDGRKVVAKHFMEGDLLTPREDDELVKEYKKWK